MIAKNAEKILAARLKGQRPAHMVLISMEAPMQSTNPIVHIRGGVVYDWRWVCDLDVCLCVQDGAEWAQVAKDIARCRPAYLAIWNVTLEWGARAYLMPTAEDVTRPVREWRYELDFTAWHDFQNKDFKEGRIYGRDEQGIPYAIN